LNQFCIIARELKNYFFNENDISIIFNFTTLTLIEKINFNCPGNNNKIDFNVSGLYYMFAIIICFAYQSIL